MGKRLYVGNLNYQTTEEALRDAFGAQGEVASVEIIAEKGFGFVEFANETDAEKAKRALNGTVLDGRCIRVDDAKEKPGRPGKPKRSDGDKPGEEVSGDIVRLSLALKLLPTLEQVNLLEDYFLRFAEAVKWMYERIPESKERKNKFATLLSEERNQKRGKCPVCLKEKKKDKRSRSGESPVFLKWKLSAGSTLVCSNKCVLVFCAGNEPSEGLGKGFGLSTPELLCAYDVASGVLKSKANSLRARRNKLKDVENQHREWLDVLNDSIIEVDGERKKARFQIQGKKGRFTHYFNRDIDQNGMLLENIPLRLETLEKQKAGLQKQIKSAEESVPTFAGNKVKVSRDALIAFGEDPKSLWFTLRLVEKNIKFAVETPRDLLPTVNCTEKRRANLDRHINRVAQSLEWLRELKATNNLPELTLYRRNSQYELVIPVWHKPAILSSDQMKDAVAVGIDLGEKRHVVVCLSSPEAKPCHVRFFKTGILRHLREQFNLKMEAIDRKQPKGTRRKIRSEVRGVRQRTNHVAHSIARDMAEYIREIYLKTGKPVILAIEDIKGIQDKAKEASVGKDRLIGTQQNRKPDIAVDVSRRLKEITQKPWLEVQPEEIASACYLAHKDAKLPNDVNPIDWLASESGGKAVHRKLVDARKKKRKNTPLKPVHVWKAIADAVSAKETALRREANRHKSEAQAFTHFLKRFKYKAWTLTDNGGKPIPIKIVDVDPKYTSKDCYKCGKFNDRKGKRYKCQNCGLNVDADFNGAVNIAKRAFQEVYPQT